MSKTVYRRITLPYRTAYCWPCIPDLQLRCHFQQRGLWGRRGRATPKPVLERDTKTVLARQPGVCQGRTAGHDWRDVALGPDDPARLPGVTRAASLSAAVARAMCRRARAIGPPARRGQSAAHRQSRCAIGQDMAPIRNAARDTANKAASVTGTSAPRFRVATKETAQTPALQRQRLRSAMLKRSPRAQGNRSNTRIRPRQTSPLHSALRGRSSIRFAAFPYRRPQLGPQAPSASPPQPSGAAAAASKWDSDRAAVTRIMPS